jgi:hypothetical protein
MEKCCGLISGKNRFEIVSNRNPQEYWGRFLAELVDYNMDTCDDFCERLAENQ